jgi:hypothetical protein
MVSNYRKKQEKLRPIIEHQAVTFAVTHLEPREIDGMYFECLHKGNAGMRFETQSAT